MVKHFKNLIQFILFGFIIISCGGSDSEDVERPISNSSNNIEAPTDNNNSDNNSNNSSSNNNNTSYDYVSDKNFINDEMTRMIDCFESLERGYLSNLFIEFIENLDSEEGEEYFEDMIDSFIELPIGEEIENLDLEQNPFNFSLYTQDYAYNQVEWSTGNQESNDLIIYLPLFQYSTFIDFAIRIRNLSQELIELETPLYLPTNFDLSAFHRNSSDNDFTSIFNISINELNYEIIDQIPIPNSVNLSIRTLPFDHTLVINKINPKVFDISFTMTESQCNFSITSRVELTNSDYENLDIEDDIKSVNLTLVMNDLSFRVNADLEYLLSLDDPTPNQLNNYIDVDVLKFGVKIAELKYVENSDEEDIKTVFLDETEIGSEDYPTMGEDYGVLEDRIEGILTRYTDNLD